MNTRTILVLIVATALASSGTAWAKKPVVDTSDASRMTVDGMYPVKHSRMDMAYAKPGLDLSSYSKVLVAPATIAYKKDSFELSEEQIQKMSRYFNEALAKELEEGGYSFADSPGADVMLVEVNIVDLKVNRPTEPSVGLTTIYTATSGEMTLIGELKDSQSGEILARFADRQQPRSYWSQSTSVSEWSEARRAFKFWAGILRDRLDAFHE